MNHFERPWILLALIPLFIYGLFYFIFQFHKNIQRLELSNQIITKPSLLQKFISFFPIIRFFTIALILFALSGPGTKISFLPDEKNGVDMMLSIDVSGSMTGSNDFLPRNRLEVSKELIQNFIRKRINDRIGICVFGGAAYLQSPLTSDIDSLIEVVSDLNQTSVPEQGTAIGDAIILSTYRLKQSKTKSKIIVIVTDGVSNTGKIDAHTAAQTAREFGIKIYTIGIGKDTTGMYQVDFESLKKISEETNGLFYRAEDPNEFETVLNSIDNLERDILESKPQTIVESNFYLFLYPAILLFCIDLLTRAILLKYYY